MEKNDSKNTEIKKLLKKTTQIFAPSGQENIIRQAIKDEIQSSVDEVITDQIGNLIALKKSTNTNGKRIMLVANMDEIGFMVTHVDKLGFVRFTPIGGVQLNSCIGSRVIFVNGTEGIIAHEDMPDKTKLPTIDQLFIDIGMTKAEKCSVRIGDVATFKESFTDLGDRVISKALNNRVGVCILIELLRQLYQSPHNIYLVFSAQKEVGARGSVTASFKIDPDIGLAIDTTVAHDFPKNNKNSVYLGKGPVFIVRDSNMLSDPRIITWMEKTAKRKKIPHQFVIQDSGYSDARSIQLIRGGVPTGRLSVPCRYLHSPAEMIDINDMENSIRLILELLKTPWETEYVYN